jgi:methyl-accepting chemotaxis protein
MSIARAFPFRATTVRGKIYLTLLALFLLMLLCSAGYLAYSQRVMVEHLVDHQTRDLADSYFDNINTLMLTGGMANREIAREKVLSRPEVIDARILRAESVTRMYGPGSDYAAPRDELDRRALEGETIRRITEGDKGRVLTLLVPLPASADFRGTNCINCHVSAEGEMLGAVRVDYSLRALDAAVNRDLVINIGINSALMIAGLLIIGAVFSRIVSSPLQKLDRMMRAVAEGRADWSQRLEVGSQDEIGDLARHFNTAIGRFGEIIDDTKRQNDAATRLKTALDCVSTNVIVADGEREIIYLNRAVRRMFRDTADDLRQRIPGFDADHLVGTRIEQFHDDPVAQRQRYAQLRESETTQLQIGGRTFRVVANPVTSEAGDRLGTAMEWTDLTASLRAEAEEQRRLEDERREAEENLRIRTALDNVSSSVMVADEDYNIIYMNKTLGRMFHDAEDALRGELPGFDADRLLGSNMDAFHRDPAHQRHMLDAMQSKVSSDMQVGGLSLRVIANPVLDAQGRRLGTVVEWANRTAEVAVEREIDHIVDAARAGDLGNRIALEGKSGFFLQLGTSINDLVEVVSNVIEDIARSMRHMADGDMTRPIEREYAGTFGEVREDVNSTVANIAQIVRQLLDATADITTGSGQISAGNNSLSARTEQQASALQQTAASMEELTATVQNNASNAQHANALAATASDTAQRGGDVVGRAIRAMEEINVASKRIAEIIGVIDEIAFQTNLLALNASVEAARAGEQGRGFAVVATEVRNLAGRSATAAKEIKELINDSVDKVDAGSALVNESGRTLEEIVAGVKKVGDIIAEIAAASSEQASGIDQVNRAVTAMDEVTQQNAALAEQTSAASSSMSDKAREMAQMVAFFTVDGATAHAVAPARTPAAAQAPRRDGQRSADDEWETF